LFKVGADGVTLVPDDGDFPVLSATMAAAVEDAAQAGLMRKPTGEFYPALPEWGSPPLFQIDRAAVPLFGIASFGVHVNGFVRRGDGIHLWIGRRAQDRAVAPGKLDNLIAGGQPIGLSLSENLAKEAEEEAGLGPEMVSRAVPVGAVSYCFDDGQGLKPDTLFLFDLELPEDVAPRNRDGEVERFDLWPLEQVAERVRGSRDFKFNVNLVVIDFMIRHGYLSADHPEYLSLIKGLRR
jgi:8-oxo-dGTP pyrophosphatase MutT (NUDIX family)